VGEAHLVQLTQPVAKLSDEFVSDGHQSSSNNRRQYNNTIYPTKLGIKQIFGEKLSTIVPESLLLQYMVNNHDTENGHMDDILIQQLMDDKKKKYDKSLRRITSFTTFSNNNYCPEQPSQFNRNITKIEEALNESSMSNSSFRKNEEDMASEKIQKHEWIPNYGNINSPLHLNTTISHSEGLRRSPEENEETQSDSHHRIRASSLLYFKNLTSQSHNTEHDPQNMINYLSQEENRIDSLTLSELHVPKTEYYPRHNISVISPDASTTFTASSPNATVLRTSTLGSYSERKTVSENILENLKKVTDSDDSNDSNKSFDMVSKIKYVIKNNKFSPKNTEGISSSIHFPILHYEDFQPPTKLDINPKKKGYISD